jgi:4-aminobutyrate aminotransferase-like enzyme
MTMQPARPPAADPVQDYFYYQVEDRTITHGEGIQVFDSEGRSYIDCGAGTFNLSLGYSHPEIVRVIRDQAERLVHCSSSYQTDPTRTLVEELVRVSPLNLNRVHLKVSGGSTANEGAIKMAMVATGRHEVITLFRSHLGQTMMMTQLSGNAFRREPFPGGWGGSLKVPDPYCRRCFYKQRPDSCKMLCVERISDFMEYASSGQVACIVVEPISGNGGNIVPPPGYFPALRAFCDQHGIVLILDEVQTGFGRTGSMFAAQHFDVRPDILTFGKGLGGSGAQVAGILTEPKYQVLPIEHHSFTNGANVLAAAAGVKTIEILERPGFLENVKRTGAHIRTRLRDLARRFRFIGDVRGVGLMIGFEIDGPDGAPDVALTNTLAARAPQHGLLLRTSRYGRGNVIKIRPPLTLSLDEADLICDRLDALFARASRREQGPL